MLLLLPNLFVLVYFSIASSSTSHAFQFSTSSGCLHQRGGERNQRWRQHDVGRTLTRTQVLQERSSSSLRLLPVLRLSQNNSDNEDKVPPSALRKRRKRKTDLDTTTATTTSTVPEEIQQENEEIRTARTPAVVSTTTSSVATIPIQDIRDLTRTTVSRTNNNDKTTIMATTGTAKRQQLTTDNNNNNNNNDEDFDDSIDPLAQLLKDAATMRQNAAKQQKSAEEDDENNNKDIQTNGGAMVTKTVRNVLSTIVTVDFFLVLALLGWFLAGIVSSTIFHDDTIQLGFNGIFQAIVQPALGILMIAALSDAILPKKEDE